MASCAALIPLAIIAPNIDPAKVIATGATEIRTAFPPDQVPAIVLAYMKGIKTVFALAIALAGGAFVTSLFHCWVRLYLKAKEENAGFHQVQDKRNFAPKPKAVGRSNRSFNRFCVLLDAFTLSPPSVPIIWNVSGIQYPSTTPGDPEASMPLKLGLNVPVV